MKVLMTGGGTGGHLYPALAVAVALKRVQPPPEILFVGASTGIEAKAVPQEGYAFRGLPARPLPRRLGLRLIRAVWSNFHALLDARRLLNEWRPDVVFATGGFASAPVLAAAWLGRVPVILQEQNSVPGLTNRIASRFAREVHLGFSAARCAFPRRGHLRLSGNPVREGIAQGSRSKAMRLFRLEDNRTTILVFGGSQGAHRVNQAILDALPHFSGRKDVQFLLQSGQTDYGPMLEGCRSVSVRTWVRPFIVNMGDAYAIADLVVCRAGAITLAELAAVGRPAVLIPYPHATADHQTRNAEASVEAGAAVMIPDGELTGERLAKILEDLISRPKERRLMSIQAMSLARPDATDRIVRAVLRCSDHPEESKPRERQRSRGGTRRVHRRNHVAAKSA